MIKRYSLISINRKTKNIILLGVDSILIILSFIIAMLLRLDNFDFIFLYDAWKIIFYLLPINLIFFYTLGIYDSVIRYFSIISVKKIFLSIFITSLLIFILDNFNNFYMPRSVPIIYLVISTFLITGFRLYARLLLTKETNNTIVENIIIYGAGEAGIQLLNTLRNLKQYNIINFIDDDKLIQNKFIDGIKVLNPKKIEHLITKNDVKTVLLCLPSISSLKKTKIINNLEKYNIKIKSIPNLSNLILGKSSIMDIDFVSVDEILTRESIMPNEDLFKINIFNKNILITGSGGSIGSELCRQIINANPMNLVLFDMSEFSLYKIHEELKIIIDKKNLNIKLFQVLGSIENYNLTKSIIIKYSIDTIYHAAAYKHVPLIEENMVEGIKNNVFGTNNLVKVAINEKVKNFTFVSTDKAVRPTNIMGASKRIGEIICQLSSKKQDNTIFSIVRFGNVLDSSGSVVPRFREQIAKGGPVTVTHKDITRYFMTIPEAAQLVIQASAMAQNANIFVLDMGEPFKIINLAERMIKLHGFNIYISTDDKKKNDNDIEIVFTGLRKGEKLYEELLIGDKPEKTSHPRIISCKEESLSQKELDDLLTELKFACDYNDNIKIPKILSSFNLGFKLIK